MQVHQEFATQSQWRAWSDADPTAATRHQYEAAVLRAWEQTGATTYLMPGWCGSCGTASVFLLDDGYSPPGRGEPAWQPNWRERLVCQTCWLNNRMRAAVTNVLDTLVGRTGPAWIAEQTTPLYDRVTREYLDLVGSEFVDARMTPGTVDASGLRHEDVTALSFGTGSLVAAFSFDVLEHVPDYPAALAETYRVLAPGGVFLWTAPFRLDAATTLVRASVAEDGSITHHLPPEYHGDPLHSSDGILCYQTFGWDVLDVLRRIGFADVVVRVQWSDELVNLGPLQITVVAHR